KDPWLPFASSLCGACAEVCPVKIDIPKILLALRSEVKEGPSARGGLEKPAFRVFAWVMVHPRIFGWLGALGARFSPRPRNGAWIHKLPGLLALPPLAHWLSQRDLPPPAPKSFHQLWKERKKK
ncbi:MAG TPA: lactate utilization protein LutB domain-containing protein, partial [Bryobacteraceae bacterium]|nr:lactate utilization protein LutB domain-containing protein [Bryobacteraceae bacterium]